MESQPKNPKFRNTVIMKTFTHEIDIKAITLKVLLTWVKVKFFAKIMKFKMQIAAVCLT